MSTPADDIARKLARSLETTAAGLRNVTSILRQSGFQEALPGYQRMRAILLSQRLWSLREGRHELERAWSVVTLSAREAATILRPFSEVLEAISRVGETVGQEGSGVGRLAALVATARAEPAPPQRPASGPITERAPFVSSRMRLGSEDLWEPLIEEKLEGGPEPRTPTPAQDAARNEWKPPNEIERDRESFLSNVPDTAIAKSKLRSLLGWPPARFEAALQALLSEKRIALAVHGRGARVRRVERTGC